MYGRGVVRTFTIPIDHRFHEYIIFLRDGLQSDECIMLYRKVAFLIPSWSVPLDLIAVGAAGSLAGVATAKLEQII